MTTLTDRYVHAVLRAVPAPQRADLEPELRAMVADAIEAHGDAATAADAERAALLELGDPALLASRYADRSRYLIGPRTYDDWRRIVSIVVPIATVAAGSVAGISAALDGGAIGEVIARALLTAGGAALQSVFWVTVVFAVLERTVGAELALDRAGEQLVWTPDALPEDAEPARLDVGDTVASIIANVFVIVGIAWVQASPPIVIDGIAYPLFDPALASSWLPWFVLVAALEIMFAVVLLMRGRWTVAMAAANGVLNIAFAAPAVALIWQDALFNPALVARLDTLTGGGWVDTTMTLVAVGILAITAFDTIDGFRRAWADRAPVGTDPTRA